MNKLMLGEKSEYNFKKIKVFFKAFTFMFMLTLMTSLSFSKVYAERYKYTVKASANETYEIIADIFKDDDGNLGVQIVGTPYNGLHTVGGEISGGTSLYNVVASDFENVYNKSKSDKSKYSYLNDRAKMLKNLLEFLVSSSRNDVGNRCEDRIYFDSKELLYSNSEGKVSWGEYKNGKSYETLIIDNVSDAASSQSPYYHDNDTRNSLLIKFHGLQLSEFFTDTELITRYESLDNKSSCSFISRVTTDESVVNKDGYRILFDETANDKYKIVKIEYDDGTKKEEVAAFAIEEKSDKSSEEMCYANSLSPYVITTSNGIELTTENKNVSNSISLYYGITTSGLLQNNNRYLSGGNISIPKEGAFVAIRNGASDSINFYVIKTNSSGKQESALIGTRKINAGSNVDVKVACGDYVIEKKGKTVLIYRKDETNLDKNAYFIDLKSSIICFNDNKNTYDFLLNCRKGADTPRVSSSGIGTHYAFIHTNKSMSKEKLYKSGASVFDIFNQDLNDSSCSMTIQIYRQDTSIETIGKNVDDDLFKLSILTNHTGDNELPPELPIKDFLASSDVKNSLLDSIRGNSTDIISKGYFNNAIKDTHEISYEFIGTILGYGKIILILLIFIAILFAGARHIIDGCVDGAKRAQTIETFKRIAFGVIIFISITLIVVLLQDFMKESFDKFTEGTISLVEQTFENEDKITLRGLILKLIELLLEVYNEIVRGLYQIMIKVLTGGDDGVSYLRVIYDVYDETGQVSSMKPFDDGGVEWTRLLSGYNCLMSIGFMVLLLGLIKTAFEYVLNAGNEKKITQIKEMWFRMFWAVLLMISIPYLVQLLLYLFNYLVAVVPINYKEARFDLDIKFDGVLGAVADNMLITTEFSLVFAFLVRHVMLSVLVVSAPIVIAFWGVSERFKSFPMWFGELITNIAMQFCYAVGFMIIIFLSFDGQNPLYGLLLISIAMGISKFIKDSLQGYFQAGAGINEEAEGQRIFKTVQRWGKKPKKALNKVGKFTEMSAKKFDPNMRMKNRKEVLNFAYAFQGKWGNIHLSDNLDIKKRKMNDAKKKLKGTEDYDLFEEYEKEWQERLKGSVNEEGKNKINGDHFIEREGGYYDVINDFYSNAIYKKDKDDFVGVDNDYTRYKKKRQEKYFDEAARERAEYNPDVEYAYDPDDSHTLEYEEDKDDAPTYWETPSDNAINLLERVAGMEEIAAAKGEIGEYEEAFNSTVSLTEALLDEDGELLEQRIAETKAVDMAYEDAIVEAKEVARAVKEKAELNLLEKHIKTLAMADKAIFRERERSMVESLTSKLAAKNAAKCKASGVKINVEQIELLLNDKNEKVYKGVGDALNGKSKKPNKK